MERADITLEMAGITLSSIYISLERVDIAVERADISHRFMGVFIPPENLLSPEKHQFWPTIRNSHPPILAGGDEAMISLTLAVGRGSLIIHQNYNIHQNIDLQCGSNDISITLELGLVSL